MRWQLIVFLPSHNGKTFEGSNSRSGARLKGSIWWASRRVLPPQTAHALPARNLLRNARHLGLRRAPNALSETTVIFKLNYLYLMHIIDNQLVAVRLADSRENVVVEHYGRRIRVELACFR